MPNERATTSVRKGFDVKMRRHLRHQHSADLAYQLSIHRLQAVKCCFKFLQIGSTQKKQQHRRTKIWTHFLSLFPKTSIFCLFVCFQIRHTVQHSKRFFFQYLIWLLTSKDVDAVGPPETDGTNSFLLPHTQKRYKYSLLASIHPNLSTTLKGEFLHDNFLLSW